MLCLHKKTSLWVHGCLCWLCVPGKDKLIFLTEDDSSGDGKDEPAEAEQEPSGVLLPNGEINWDCPCLGGRADGPCGDQFKDAFSCFVKR